MARSVMAAILRLQAREVGKLVDAFLADHGGIHVGEEKPLAAVLRRLNDDINAVAERWRNPPAMARWSSRFRRERECRPQSRARASAGASVSARAFGRASSDAVIERAVRIADESRDMSHAMHAANRAVLIAGPTASGKSALASDARRSGSTARSSTPIPCRSIAICASSRRARRPKKKRAFRIGSMGMSTQRRIIPSGRWMQATSP